jgi:diphthine-ammonia ligase
MSTRKLKVIALISGGKDSLFSILHCLANGHDVVALANLYPEGQDAEDEDIDSYMYQTVGHSIIPLYAEVLGIPLFRQPIVGNAVNSSREYAPQASQSEGSTIALQKERDETESLVPLLQRILEAHPEATAVSTGAILSTYQRTRVESVAIRLNLIPLSYLWQYPYLPPYQQSSLLQDMRNVGQDARIIKVASGGLDESFLWQNVADDKVVRRLKKRMESFGGGEGGAILGEGGEFETLAIGGPGPLWKGRIDAGDVNVVMGEGGCAVVRLKNFKVVKGTEETSDVKHLRIPNLLDDEFRSILHKLEKASGKESNQQQAQHPISPERTTLSTLSDTMALLSSMSDVKEQDVRTQNEGSVHISNIIHPSGTVTEQMRGIMSKLQYHLQTINLNPSSITSSTLLLRDMSDFTTINPIYGAIFTEPTPPSRITVACGDVLPAHIHVILSVVIDAGPKSRRSGLHVQSRSYWAPANIGPYSQAISVPIASVAGYEDDAEMSTAPPKLASIAGQIPLVPASMELVTSGDVLSELNDAEGTRERDFVIQTVLSLQHLWRIGRVMDVKWWNAGIAFISKCAHEEGNDRAKLIVDAWRFAHGAFFDGKDPQDEDSHKEDDGVEEEEEEVVDVWDQKYRSGFQNDSEERDTRPLLPNYERLHPITSTFKHPFCFVVQVSQLPRAAAVEWTSTGFVDASVILGGSTLSEAEHFTVAAHARGTDCEFYYQPIHVIQQLVELSNAEDRRKEDVGPSTGGKWTSSWTIYATVDLPEEILRRWKPLVVPCTRVWSGGIERGVREVAAMVAIRREAYSPVGDIH